MNNKLLFLLILFSNVCFCQTILSGKITNLNDIDGIHITNISNKESTISDDLGRFKLPVRLNDTILIKSLLYETKTITITNEILKKEAVDINLISASNTLETVYLGNTLSGNLNMDIKSIQTKVPIEISLTNSFKGLGKYKGTLKPDNQSAIASEPMPGGVDIIGLVMMLIPKKERVTITNEKPLSYSRKDLVLYYGVNFFKNDLKISKVDEERFIQFSEFDEVVKSCLKKRDKFNLLTRLLALREQFVVSK